MTKKYFSAKPVFIYFFFQLMLVSCSAPVGKHEKIEKMRWLLGNWEVTGPEGNYYESWKEINDSVFTGQSFFISGNDTLSAEYVSLEEKDGSLFYIPTVKDQNEGKPVPFKMISSDNEIFQFENPEHDFPQKITYRQLPPDSLLAEISGVINGQEQKQEFPMKRSK